MEGGKVQDSHNPSFFAFWNRHLTSFYQAARRIGNANGLNAHDQEDVVHDVLERITKGQADMLSRQISNEEDGERRAKLYVYQSIVNRARTLGHERRREVVIGDPADYGHMRSPAADDQVINLFEARETLKRANGLPKVQREVWKLTVNGLSTAEIAERRGMTEQAVRTALSRARGSLAQDGNENVI